MNILFIGNSYTMRNDLPGMLQGMVSDMIHCEMLAEGGFSFEKHLRRSNPRTKLAERKWDHVVLQEQSTRPFEDPEKMLESGQTLAANIREQGAELHLYQTWARKNDPGKQEAINSAYAELSAKINASIVPVGDTWQSFIQEHPDIELYNPDLSHPAPAGTFLSACVFHRHFFDEHINASLVDLVSDKIKQLILEHTAPQNAPQTY